MIPYLYTLFTLAFFFLSGHFVFFILKIKRSSNPYFNVFAKLFTGLVVFITLYSICKTNGKTINTGFLLIGFSLIYYLRKNNLCLKSGYETTGLFKFNLKNDIRIFSEIIIIALGWFAIQYYGYQKTNYYFTDGDTANYSKIAEYLNITGNENIYNLYNSFDMYKGTTPYHYFEIWLCSGIAYFYNMLVYEAYLKVMVPVFLTIISMGLIALFKMYFKTNYFNLLVPFFLFCRGTIFPFYPEDVSTFNLIPIIGPKTAPTFMGLIFFVLLFKKNIPLSFIVLSSAILMSISAALGVGGGIILMILYLFFKEKAITRHDFWFILLHIFLLAIFMFTFYAVTGIKEKSLYHVIQVPYFIRHIKTPVHIFTKSVLELMLLYCPYIFIAAFLLLTGKRIPGAGFIFKITVFTVIASLFAWALLYQMADSVQLFSVTAIPITNVCIIYLLIALLYELSNTPRKLIIFLPVIFILIGKSFFEVYLSERPIAEKSYSSRYINSINSVISANSINPTGIYVKGKMDYVTFFNKNPLYSLGDYLKLMKPDFNTVSLSVFDTPIDSSDIIKTNRENQLIESSAFYKFTNDQKTRGVFKTIQQSQIDFIETYHINYGIISKNASLSEGMNGLISRTITDNVSGERFVIFK